MKNPCLSSMCGFLDSQKKGDHDVFSQSCGENTDNATKSVPFVALDYVVVSEPCEPCDTIVSPRSNQESVQISGNGPRNHAYEASRRSQKKQRRSRQFDAAERQRSQMRPKMLRGGRWNGGSCPTQPARGLSLNAKRLQFSVLRKIPGPNRSLRLLRSPRVNTYCRESAPL
jgi:hypothetical protein